MLVACWSAKGGVGTTVVAAALALQIAPGAGGATRAAASGAGDAATAGVVLADLAGDAPAVLGLPEPESPGLAGWLAAGDDVPADSLARLEVAVAPGLHLLPRGRGGLRPGRSAVLAALLDRSPRVAVVDCGQAGEATADALIARGRPSLLVIRRCYLALRRAAHAGLRPTGVVVVNEPGRVLSSGDVSATVGAPVVAEVQIDPAVARQVDAGLLAGRLPRSLQPLRAAA